MPSVRRLLERKLLMTYSRRVKTLSLGFVLLSLLSVRAADGQAKNRLVPFPEWASSYDEDEEVPLELVEIKVAGRQVILGQVFSADENWLKDMTLRVKNISNKPIIAFGVGGGLLGGVGEELPPHASFAYGIGWQWGKPFNPEKERPFGVALKPGEIAELSYANVDDLTRKVLAKEGEGAFSKLKFMAPGVEYEDGTAASMPKMKFYGSGKP
jgi:hypothetical protein